MQRKAVNSASEKGWKTLVIALTAAALAACNDSGSSSDDNGSNGDSASDGQDSDRVLVYEEMDINAFPDQPLYAVSADDPADITPVTPAAHANQLATGGGPSSSSTPDNTNLPLGVLGGDFGNGELTNAGYDYTLFNTEDGELFRLDTRNGNATAERFSSEDDASAICAAFVAPDLADIDNSRLVYQVAADNSCDDSEIRMARVGDDESGDIVTLQSDVADEEQLDTVRALRDADGGLTEVLFYLHEDGHLAESTLMVHNLDSGEQTTLKDDLVDFSVLGYTDGGETLIFMRNRSATNVGTFRAYNKSEGVVTFSGWQLQIGIDESNAVQVGDKLYVVDHSESEVIEVDGTEANIIDSDWSTADSVEGVTAANGYLAFAYQTQGNWNIRQVSLSDGNAQDIVTGLSSSTDFSMNSDKAPGSDDSYWYLYTETGPVAHGVEFTTGGGTFEIDDARWRGETWSRTVGDGGFQAEYLFYQESGQGGALYSVDATDSDPASTSRNMAVDPLNWGIWVGGFGPQTLVVGRAGQSSLDNTREVLHVDASAADSAVRLTDDEDAEHRPVPFY